MRALRLISCCLALSLAFGGAVAISPALHRLMDHGGHGRPHSHYRATHVHAPSYRAESQTQVTFGHTFKPFGLPEIDLSRFWHRLAHWLAGHPANSSSDDEPGHEHHSLSQLLAGGLLEQTLDFPALEQIVVFIAIPVLPSDDPLLEENWDAQSASRGPPFRRG